MIPDISSPLISISPVQKQAPILQANMTNISVTALSLRNLTCLKMSAPAKPKRTPIVTEMTPRRMNYPAITKIVNHWNQESYKELTVLNKMIDTISLNTPSPKMHEQSLGCSWQSTMETAATTSLLHNSEVKSIKGSKSSFTGLKGSAWTQLPIVNHSLDKQNQVATV